MPRWHEEIDLSDVWVADIPFEHKRDRVVARIKGSEWYKEAQRSTFPNGLVSVVADLSLSASPSEFDAYMHELWDRADIDRVWVGTF